MDPKFFSRLFFSVSIADRCKLGAFVLVTPEGFTVAVANDGLKKARAYESRSPLRSTALYIPLKDAV